MQHAVGATGSGIGLMGALLEMRHLAQMMVEPFSACATWLACAKVYALDLDDTTFLAVTACALLLVTSALALVYFILAMMRPSSDKGPPNTEGQKTGAALE